MTTNTTEISTLRDDNGNIIIPLTVAQAVLFDGKPLTGELSRIDDISNDLSTVKEMLGNIQTLLTQVNQKLNEHTSE